MSSFIEFQALVLDKLCSIESRISNIESVLGIDEVSSKIKSEETITDFESKNNSSFKDEISDFQKQLTDLKSLFNESDN